MRERMRMNGLFTTCLVAGFGLTTGCQDQDARERAEVQETIRSESTAFQLARVGSPVPGTEEFDTKKQKLDTLAGRLSGISGGNDGQQSTKSILLANTMTELASMDMAHAEKYERENALISAQLIGIIQGGMNLSGMMESRQGIDLQTSRSQLSQDKETAETKLGLLNEQLDELAGPIADREGQNTRDAEEVNALRKSSDELFRNARERGYASGFNSFEEAIQARRAADRIEYEIAQREIVLDLNLKAEQGYINLNTQQINKAIEANSNAQAAIDTHQQTGTEDARNTEQLITTLRSDLDALLQQLADKTSDDLNPHYDSAQEYLEKAGREAQSAASKAGRNGDSNGPNLIGARAQQSLGKLHWTKSRGITTRRKLYELVHQARELFSNDSVLPKIEQLTQQHADAVEMAKASYAQAIQLISKVNNPKTQNEINAFKQSLDISLAALNGQQISTSMSSSAPTSGVTPAMSASRIAETRVQGFDSPEALMRHLKSAAQSGDIVAILNSMRITDPEVQREADTVRGMLSAIDRLEKSIQASMGADADAASSMIAPLKLGIAVGFVALANATEVSRTDDRVSHEVNFNGEKDELDFIHVDGQWVIDGDDPTDDPELLQQITSMTRSLNTIADSLDNGDITTVAELGAAMQRAMQS